MSLNVSSNSPGNVDSTQPAHPKTAAEAVTEATATITTLKAQIKNAQNTKKSATAQTTKQETAKTDKMEQELGTLKSQIAQASVRGQAQQLSVLYSLKKQAYSSKSN